MRRSVAVALALTLLSPLALLLWLLLTPEPAPSSIEDQQVWTEAVQREDQVSFQARVELRFGEGGTLVYRGEPGTITAMHLAPGDRLDVGDPVVDVDTVTRLAYHGDVPMHRDLTTGNEGADVAALQRFLRLTGEDTAADGRYGAQTAQAVERLARSLGVERPDGTFARGWVVWLESEGTAVEDVAVHLADAVDSGSVLATTAPEVAGATLTHPSGERLTLPHDGPWRLVLDGEDAGVFTEPSEIAQLPVAMRIGSERREEASAVLDAVVQEASPTSVIAVPSAAVHVRADGQACVVRETDDGGRATEVTLGPRGTFGDVQLTSGVRPSERVLVAPVDRVAQWCS